MGKEINVACLHHARVLWQYHQLHHEVTKSDVGLGLGSHDLGVAKAAVKLYKSHYFPILIFSGGNSSTTRKRFPLGEAVHYAQYAVSHGVPSEHILIEPCASNTSENFVFARELLLSQNLGVQSLLVICKPYMQRRAFLACRKIWPEVSVRCTSEVIDLDDYIVQIGDPKLVLDMLVGDTQRIIVYGENGFTLKEKLPDDVQASFNFLLHHGFTSRLIDEGVT